MYLYICQYIKGPTMTTNSSRRMSTLTLSSAFSSLPHARYVAQGNEKSPQLRGLMCVLVLLGAGHCQTWNHSHSIVAGGLLETS